MNDDAKVESNDGFAHAFDDAEEVHDPPTGWVGREDR
jgi:hypothetical protein